jgi:hypothetical protein
MPVLVEDAGFDFDKLTGRLPASVTTTRTSPADLKTRQLIVWMDDKRVATLLWGDSVTCELEPGPHRLRISNTLFRKTIDFTLAPGEQAFFEAINHLGPGSVLVTMLFGAGPLYLTVKRMC